MEPHGHPANQRKTPGAFSSDTKVSQSDPLPSDQVISAKNFWHGDVTFTFKKAIRGENSWMEGTIGSIVNKSSLPLLSRWILFQCESVKVSKCSLSQLLNISSKNLLGSYCRYKPVSTWNANVEMWKCGTNPVLQMWKTICWRYGAIGTYPIAQWKIMITSSQLGRVFFFLFLEDQFDFEG